METQTNVIALPEFFVGRAATRACIDRYLVNKHPVLSTTTGGKKETVAVWYTKEHIEQLWREMRLLDADGLTIYLGSYGDDHGETANQICLLMVPTRTINGKRNEIELEDEPDYTMRYEARENVRQNTPNPNNNPDLSETDRAFNQGGVCPPFYLADRKYYQIEP